MADYAGDAALGVDALTNRYTRTLAIHPIAPSGTPGLRVIFDVDADGGTHETTGEGSKSVADVDFGADCAQDVGALSWFERVWVKPSRIELGNVLTTITREIEIYNSYREEDRTLSAAVNNAGAGISFTGLPGLPATIPSQAGELFNVVVLTTGPPEIDGTLDFTLDTGAVSIPITGTRVVMFPFVPERPIKEVLEFETDIITSGNGKEQRISERKHPRQLLKMAFMVEEDEERRRLMNQLFGWHAGVFGVPIWFEARSLGAAVVATDTLLTVDTNYGDFRVGSLVMVWQDSSTFDAVEIQSLTASSITLSAGLNNGYSAGALVMPLRVGYSDEKITGRRFLKNLDSVELQFTLTDNEADISDTAAFSTHNSKVMLDDPNSVQRGSTIQDDLIRKIRRFDNRTAPVVQATELPISLYATTKGFSGDGREQIWNVRRLVHALRGSHLSFYLPTFFKDIEVETNLASGSFNMDIVHAGYTDYVNAQEPNASIWIELTDGTIVTREVQSASEIDSDTERLVVDVAWGSTITPAEISRVSFLRLVRIADDQVQITHKDIGDAEITMNVVGVRQ